MKEDNLEVRLWIDSGTARLSAKYIGDTIYQRVPYEVRIPYQVEVPKPIKGKFLWILLLLMIGLIVGLWVRKK